MANAVCRVFCSASAGSVASTSYLVPVGSSSVMPRHGTIRQGIRNALGFAREVISKHEETNRSLDQSGACK